MLKGNKEMHQIQMQKDIKREITLLNHGISGEITESCFEYVGELTHA